MTAPDPKVVALTEAECEVLRKAFAVWLLSPKTRTTLVSAAIPAVEHIVAARVAAVVASVLALADEWKREARRPMFGSDDVARAVAYDRAAKAARAAVESTDAPAALARVKAEAWDEGEQAGRDNADDGYPDPVVENPYRIETEAVDPS